ncbi:MAG: hypothetical protein WCI93_00870 [bacterium]
MKIEWNKVTWYSKIFAVILFVLVFCLGFYFGKIQEKINSNNVVIKEIVVPKNIIENGRQCFTYTHEATKIEPYLVNEFIDIVVGDGVIKGTKNGNQKGPDLTNGYTGTLNGEVLGNTINAVFSYVTEGSLGKEKEIYKIKEDKTGIEKLRYQLLEKNGMLVPDMTKDFKIQLYARVGCTASN